MLAREIDDAVEDPQLPAGHQQQRQAQQDQQPVGTVPRHGVIFVQSVRGWRVDRHGFGLHRWALPYEEPHLYAAESAEA